MQNTLNIRAILLSLVLLTPHGAAAGPSSYICQITDFKGGHRHVGELAMEDTVAIDRVTGRVIHPLIGSTSFNNVTLLNKGSASWAFKALADSGKGGHVRYYEVLEFEEGAVKTFLAIADHMAFFGDCR